MKPHPSPTPLIKINSKWIKNLNIRPETIKHPEEKKEKKNHIHNDLGNNFFGI